MDLQHALAGAARPRSDSSRLTTRTTWIWAAALTMLAFAFRFVTFRGFTNDQFQHLAWAQQMAHGAWPGRDFAEPGMPLMIALSAVFQHLWPGPFSEAVFTEVMLALATGVTCVVAADLSGSLLIGIGAALAQTGLEPRLYNYPKILVPAVALLLLQYYFRRRSARRIVLLAAWTVAGFLFRHDLGLIAAAATCAALAWPAGRSARETARSIAIYIVAGLCLVAPYVMYVQATTGLAEHVRVAIEFTKVETHQTILPFDDPSLPAVTSGHLSSWGREDASAFLYWLYQALLVTLAAVLLVGRRRMDDRTRATVAALLVFIAGYRILILRYPLLGRIADIASLVSIAGLWCFAEACRVARERWRHQPIVAILIGSAAVAVAIVSIISVWTQPVLSNEIFEESGIKKGMRGVFKQAIKQVDTRNDLAHYWPAGYPPPLLEYARVCTASTDHLLVTWSAPEYYVLSGRQFAGMHAMVLAPRAFATPQDEAGMLDGLQKQQVPVVFVNKTELRGFSEAYPNVTAYLQQHYREVGHVEIRDGSDIAVVVRKGLEGTTTFNEWPCGFRTVAADSQLRAGDRAAVPQESAEPSKRFSQIRHTN